MPCPEVISKVAEAWNTTKPRMTTFEEVASMCGPRESACDYVPGGKAELRATRASADFLRYLLALAVGTSVKLVAGAALTTHSVLDGATGLRDANHIVGLKATMALVMHARYALAIRNATFAQAYELRSRISEAASRLQSPSSSTPISITAALAGVLDSDSLKLASVEDVKLAVPASVTDAAAKDETKKEDKKDDKKGDKKGDGPKKAAAKKAAASKGKGKGRGGWQGNHSRRSRSRSRSPDRRRRSRLPDRGRDRDRDRQAPQRRR